MMLSIAVFQHVGRVKLMNMSTV